MFHISLFYIAGINGMLKIIERFRGELSVAIMRVSNIAMAPLAALAIATSMSPEQQGYYFSFVAILTARYLFEAGVSQVVVTTVGQVRGSVQVLDSRNITGCSSSLSAVHDIFKFSLIWYSLAAIFMLFVVGGAGYVFFDSENHSGVNWVWPWVFYITLGCVDFATLGFWATLEGLDGIAPVYLFRALKAIASVLVLALIVSLGGGLWGVVGFQAVSVLVNFCFIIRWRRTFLLIFRHIGGVLDWRTAIWPFQWRLAVSWAIGGYITVPLFVPVLFHTSGAIEAGRVGMTLAIMGAAASLGQSAMDAKVPHFCSLIAAGRWVELDREFFRRGVASLLVFLGALICGVLAIIGFDFLGVNFGSRIVSWPIFVIFAFGALLNLVIAMEANYLRWHRREPLMLVSVINGLFTLAATVILAKHYGSKGVAAGYFGVAAVFFFPATTVGWLVLRRRWHSRSEILS